MFQYVPSFLFTYPVSTDVPQAFAALADNAKHNQTGRVDEHGALRHRIPELCGVGALAMLFFAHFHILSSPVPNFAPDFNGPNSGQYGIREWYQYHVFYPTRGSLTKEMTYESESSVGFFLIQLTSDLRSSRPREHHSFRRWHLPFEGHTCYTLVHGSHRLRAWRISGRNEGTRRLE